ncbi:hypothetical protein GCM10009727_38860 [Actinomadura napierensis]|uniref:GntR family transcriptional regulator n=1 Tax=Actinomadura napierensis TaxID=267854 RepID=A0ABP5L9Z1_9ACTN
MDLTTINLDQPRPAYRIIAAAIADEIRAGRLRPGQRIPRRPVASPTTWASHCGRPTPSYGHCGKTG